MVLDITLYLYPPSPAPHVDDDSNNNCTDDKQQDDYGYYDTSHGTASTTTFTVCQKIKKHWINNDQAIFFDILSWLWLSWNNWVVVRVFEALST